MSMASTDNAYSMFTDRAHSLVSDSMVSDRGQSMLSMPSAGTEDEMMAELERAKQASRAACIAEISSHLHKYTTVSAACSYEAWIAELHPESVRGESMGKPVIDYRYYLEDSDHRVLWNAKVGPARAVPARDPSSSSSIDLREAGRSAFPPGVDVSVPLLIPRAPPNGFHTLGGFSGSYVPPPPDQRPLWLGGSWQPQPRRDTIAAAPYGSRSYVKPMDPLLLSTRSARPWPPPMPAPSLGPSWVAAPAPSSGSFDPTCGYSGSFVAPQPVALPPSSWMPPRTAARSSWPHIGSAYAAPSTIDVFMQDFSLRSSFRVPASPQRVPAALPLEWQRRAPATLPQAPQSALYLGPPSSAAPLFSLQVPQVSLPPPPMGVPVATYAIPGARAPPPRLGFVQYHG